MLNALQKCTAQAIVNIFESGSVQGKYGQVTLIAGDSGHLTYGRSQTTLASGNLFLLLKSYVEVPEARLKTLLARFLPALAQRDLSLDSDTALHELLREAGDDPVMQDVQDEFFDRVYWQPAVDSAARIGIAEALGVAVVYDSHIHGSWARMRDRTVAAHGSVATEGEREWVRQYVGERRDWLGNHFNRLLRRTVYRMDSFITLIADDAWSLPLPLNVRGVRIDEASISDGPPLRVSADESFARMLRLKSPAMRGDDVLELQQLLTVAGFETKPDGVFGPKTESRVKAFQKDHGLLGDGIVGPATRSALGGI
jgi:chitosanase